MAGPWVVIDHDRVIAMTPAAADAGVRIGMRRGGVAAVAPHAGLIDRDPTREAALLHDAAMALLQYTPEIAHAEHDSLLLNIGASLLMFGGPAALCRRIRHSLRQLGCQARLGMAPTAQGAWLLACHAGGGSRRLLKPSSLTRRLMALPCMLLTAAQEYRDWLDGIGCRTVGAMLRLPRAGLQRRCGKPLLKALDQALGRAPELFEWIEPPPSFQARIELIERIEHTASLMFVAQRLVQQMTGWLAAHHRSVSRIEFLLEHERGRHARPPTPLAIALATPTWQADHLMLLLKESLAQLALAAPVIAIGLQASQVTARTADSAALFTEPGGTPADHQRLLELLQARLGADCVLQPQPCADHLPEVANAWGPAIRPGAAHADAGQPDLSRERPFWLLEQPLALSVDRHRPFHGSPLRLLRGPERIESGWWNAAQVHRDYFIAEAQDQSRYWIYRERLQHDVRWFLHGLFA